MQNKTTVIVVSLILILMSAYYLSFTFVSRGVVKDANEHATVNGVIDNSKKQAYLDSVWKKPVFNLVGMEFTYKEVKETELNLGLDLQGGMSVMLEVLSGNNPDPTFQKALTEALNAQKNSTEDYLVLFEKSFEQLDPQARLSIIFQNASNKEYINYNSTNAQVIKYLMKEIQSSIDIAFEVIKTRIDKFGVSQPNIQKIEGTSRIYIELPGVDNPERVRKLLQGTAKLEFFEVWEPKEFVPVLKQLNTSIAEKNKLTEKTTEDTLFNSLVKKDTTEKDLSVSNQKDTISKAEKDSAGLKNFEKQLSQSSDTVKDTTATDSLTQSKNNPLFMVLGVTENGSFVAVNDTAKLNKMLTGDDAKNIFPPNMKFAYEVKPVEGTNKAEFLNIHFLKTTREKKAPLTGEVITDATQDIDAAKPIVSMQMNKVGAKKWKRLTEDNVGRKIAIILDGYIYSAPRVQSPIPNGRSQISGNFTIEEAQDLANVLKAGKLPAPTHIIEEAVVGPTLGSESISAGLWSFLLAFFLIIIYMILYYNISGGFADFSLLLNVFMILGVLSQFGAALTLPGIAGIVLTLGMAVDANVIIYERIREEMRHGKNMASSVRDGFSRAYSAIIDGNATTFLIGIILYATGSGPIKGFAVTLMIGILTSLFTAIFVSRFFIEWFLKFENNKILQFDTFISKNLMLNTKFDVIGKRKWAYIFSGSLILFGLTAVWMEGGLKSGVDFLGGRSYLVAFDKDVSAAEIRQPLRAAFQGTGCEVKTYNNNKQLKIITTYLVDDNSESADKKVETALMNGLGQYAGFNPQILETQKVGSTIADDISSSSKYATVLSLLVIFIYILIRFHKWQFGFGATIALFHDVLMVFACFGIVGLFGTFYEVDQAFVAAVLTVIGYSINDTVIIFDRIREHLQEHPRANLADTINEAVNRTFSRTINTALTTLIVVVILYLMGGEVLKGFSFALIIGVVFGTYSSLFIATPLLLETTKNKLMKQGQ